MATREIAVPDIGDFKNIPVIEIFVKVGDVVAKDAPLVQLESDKATVDVPTTAAGTIKELKVKVGDRLSKGSIIAVIETDGAEAASGKAAEKPAAAAAPAAATAAKPAAPAAAPA
ncbi:MAG TPA: biotin/lipoyl-containing protein, partial [Polyangia bacterium]